MPLRAVETVISGGGASNSIVIPATAQVGDIATLVASAHIAPEGGLQASGWTWHGRTEPNPSNMCIGTWTKTLTADDLTAPGNTLTIDGTYAGRWSIVVMVRYDVIGLDATPVLTNSWSLETEVEAPSITTVTHGAELISVYGCQVYDSGDQVAYHLPVGQALVANACGGSSSYPNNTLCLAEEVMSVAGPSGVRVAYPYNIDEPGNSERVRTSAVTLAFTPLVPLDPPFEGATVMVRQSGAWAEKSLKARSGGDWV